MDLKRILGNRVQPEIDRPSEKDYRFASLLPDMKKFNRKEKILREMTPISNQGEVPSCTSNAVCDAFEHIIADRVELSRLFVYWNSRPNKTVASGTSIRSALDSVRKYGVPPEYVWPYDQSKVNAKPSDSSWKIAEARKRTTYYRVTSQQEIIAAIDAGWPVVFCISLDEKFVSPDLDKETVFTGHNLTNYFHTMIVVGYRIIDDQCHFRIRNSWGEEWCDKGYCWFDSAYVSRSMLDAWAVTNYTPDEPIFSRRNLEFAITTLATVGTSSFFVAARESMTLDQLIPGLLICAALQAASIWRRWWINVTINDKLPLL